ncbi:MAG: anthranilate phosphoribosyltransferase [Acidimicrobiia bacterium]|nr:anthranilate phosphoribosyltransferase [Acidimicrobiia bacterium]
MTELIERLLGRQDLTAAEAEHAMHEVMEGRVPPARLAGFLVALAAKGERPEEIVGLARTMRAHAVPLEVPPGDIFDSCGTGGDRSGTFNISSAAAVVVAACGVRVAKHGNRSVSSRCGSADVFEQLGVNVTASPAQVARALETAGIAFCFAPTFHPSMKHAGPTRRELGIRTAFNLIGPLTNPAGANRQVVGVPAPELTELIAQALVRLGTVHAWVVHGAGGLDEISTLGHTKVAECLRGRVHTFYLHPSDVGVARCQREALAGGDAAASAAILTRVLDGEPGPARDVVLLNAGAGLYVAGRAASVQAGIIRAAAAIDSGAARETLARMASASHEDGA